MRSFAPACAKDTAPVAGRPDQDPGGNTARPTARIQPCPLLDPDPRYGTRAPRVVAAHGPGCGRLRRRWKRRVAAWAGFPPALLGGTTPPPHPRQQDPAGRAIGESAGRAIVARPPG